MKKSIVIIFILLVILFFIAFAYFFFINNKNNPIKNQNTIVKNLSVSGSCKILEEKFCSTGKFITKKIDGKDYIYVELTIPPGTEIKSPISGQLAKGNTITPFAGSFAIVRPPHITESAAIYYGDIEFDNMMNSDVQAGEIIGRSKGNGLIYFTMNSNGGNDAQYVYKLFKK